MTLIASSYPFLDILWTTLIFFAWVIFIWIAITVLIDIFRRHDLSGWAKAAWVVFVVDHPVDRRPRVPDRQPRRDDRAPLQGR